MPYYAQTSPVGPSFAYIEPSLHVHGIRALRKDDTSEDTINLEAPDLILLFPRTGTKPCDLKPYLARYIQWSYWTPIIVVTSSSADLLYRTAGKLQSNLKPAVDLALSLLPSLSSGRKPNVLCHCFSNGFDKYTHFASAYLSRMGVSLSTSVLISDSMSNGDPVSARNRKSSADGRFQWEVRTPKCYLFPKDEPSSLVSLRKAKQSPYAKEDETEYWEELHSVWAMALR